MLAFTIPATDSSPRGCATARDRATGVPAFGYSRASTLRSPIFWAVLLSMIGQTTFTAGAQTAPAPGRALAMLQGATAPDDQAASNNANNDDARQDQKNTPAAKAENAAGRLVRVTLPITGNADTRIIEAIKRAKDSMPTGAAKRPVIVLEFSTGSSEFGLGNEFEDTFKLARFLTSAEMAGVHTVAYLPKSIRGHGVLVALACEEIVMQKDAEIGDAGADEPAGEPIDPAVANNYREIANRRKTIPVAVALGMLNPDLEVLKVVTDLSTEYILSDDLERLEKERTIVSKETIIPPGEMGRFTGQQARQELGVKYLPEDRQSLARALGLSVEALADDPSLSADWNPIRVQIRGSIDGITARTVRKMIQDQITGQGVNFVLVQIDSSGGRLLDAVDLANYVAAIDPGQVRVVGFVPQQAGGEAALVALACHQLVVAPDATIGGELSAPVDAQSLEQILSAIRQWRAVQEKERTWSLPMAFLDKNLQVSRYQHRQSGEIQYFSEEELQEQNDPQAWNRGAAVTTRGTTLQVDGLRAKELGLVWDTAKNLEQLKEKYALDDDPRLVEPGWAEHLIEALASPGVAILLLMIGGMALYAELQMPGVGVGGFIAAIAFLLFFWSRYLNGTAFWLEAVLFVGGVCFLLLELFILPGFGIFGLGGGLMIISSLILASQTFIIPRTAAQFQEMRGSIMIVLGAGLGMIAGAAVLRRYLPHAPLFSRMMLEPPDTRVQFEREALVHYHDLVGQQGVTTTQLTPSGKARIGDALIDVICEGDVIDRGAKVVVVRVHGNRVIVGPASDT